MKVWLYARSTTGENIAIAKQMARLEAFAAEKGHQVIGASQDVGSGSDFDREGLNEVKVAAAKGKINALLVTDFARIGRNTLKCAEFVNVLGQNDIEIVALDVLCDGSASKSENLFRLMEAYCKGLSRETYCVEG